MSGGFPSRRSSYVRKSVSRGSERSYALAIRSWGARAAPLLVLSLLVIQIAFRGIPLDREQVLLWTTAGLVAVSFNKRDDRILLRVVRDWVPLVCLLLLYDLSRGAADALGMPVQEWFPAWFDRWLFGGELPTWALQRRFLTSPEPGRWDALVSLVYVSHFIIPYAILAALWIRNRAVWVAASTRFIVLTLMALATYALVPTAPPWLLARQGKIEPVSRSAARGWGQLHLTIAGDLVEKGQASVNLVAALPSLHAAYPMLFVIVLWPIVGPTGRALALSYSCAMAFVLVLSAEHFVFDIVLGWAYALVACVAIQRIEHRKAQHVAV